MTAALKCACQSLAAAGWKVTCAACGSKMSTTPPQPVVGPTGEGDGTSAVIEATQLGKFPRFFVKSTSQPGVWWRVDFVPGEALTCSCPWGRGISWGDSLRIRGCRHMRSVCDRMAAEAEAQRVRS